MRSFVLSCQPSLGPLGPPVSVSAFQSRLLKCSQWPAGARAGAAADLSAGLGGIAVPVAVAHLAFRHGLSLYLGLF